MVGDGRLPEELAPPLRGHRRRRERHLLGHLRQRRRRVQLVDQLAALHEGVEVALVGEVVQDDPRRIVGVCASRGVYVLTDECYLFFAYPPAEPFTSASLSAELRQYVCVAGSFSSRSLATAPQLKSLVLLQGSPFDQHAG